LIPERGFFVGSCTFSNPVYNPRTRNLGVIQCRSWLKAILDETLTIRYEHKQKNMKFILGRKINMTQRFDDKGIVTPVTAILVEPNTVTKIKTAESDGYAAVQVGLGSQKESRVNKAQLGANGGKAYKAIKEFRLEGSTDAIVGDAVDLSSFLPGDAVVVTSTSKAKGFQGVVKRHGFHGGPRSHGQKHSEREPGSIGGGPGRAGGRVVLGMRMAGRTGGDIVTVKGLKVVAVDVESQTLYISGAVPGRRGTLVSVIVKES
jgi:large subunit ribosomal protein L3